MPDNEPAKLPVYAGWSAAVKRYEPSDVAVACCILRGRNLLAGWRTGVDPAVGKGGIPGGSVEGSETPRAACQRIVRSEIGLDLEPYYAAWVGRRAFSVRSKDVPVCLFICGLDWGTSKLPVGFDNWHPDRVKRYEDGLDWHDPVVQSGSRYQVYRWVEIEAARATPQRLSPVLQWAVEIITRPPPEIAFSFEVEAVPIIEAGKVRRDD